MMAALDEPMRVPDDFFPEVGGGAPPTAAPSQTSATAPLAEPADFPPAPGADELRVEADGAGLEHLALHGIRALVEYVRSGWPGSSGVVPEEPPPDTCPIDEGGKLELALAIIAIILVFTLLVVALRYKKYFVLADQLNRAIDAALEVANDRRRRGGSQREASAASSQQATSCGDNRCRSRESGKAVTAGGGIVPQPNVGSESGSLASSSDDDEDQDFINT